MKTVGELLKTAREAKKLTLDQVEKATKIRMKFLQALEADQLDRLPPGTFTKGFIKNYAKFLGLPEDEMMAFYRRQVDEVGQRVLPKKNQDFLGKRFSLTPQILTSLSIILLVGVFFAYLIFSYFRYAGSPTLIVSSPKNNTVLTSDQVEVAGKTDPDASLAINNQAISVSENGSFSVKVPLQPGLNTLTVVSTNRFKRQSTETVNVRLEQ